MADLRPITSADAGLLAALHAQAFDHPWSAAEFESLIRTGAAGWLADAGFILTRTAAGESEILTVAVAPSARRQGLGRRLVEAPIAGAEAVFLEVADDNLAAIALYRAAGFEAAGRRRGYYMRPVGAVDALVLRKSLVTRA